MEQTTGVGVRTQEKSSSQQRRNNASADGVSSTSIVQNVEVQLVSDNTGLDMLQDDIGNFLERHKGTVGTGYAEVTSEEIRELQTLIYRIIEAKWARDVDGDLPVEFEIIDRTLYWHSSFLPVPYENGFDSMLTNLEIAASRVRGEMSVRRAKR